jgi:CSLREA domain-containing protein
VFAEAFEQRCLLSAFVVNSLADTHDANPGDGIAADVWGQTSLRAAVEEANALPGLDTIELPAGSLALLEANGPLPIADDLIIRGVGEASEINGSVFDSVFSVAPSAHLNLEKVAVVSGQTLAARTSPTLLTTNARQADLIVAFAPGSMFPIPLEAKTPTSFLPLSGPSSADAVLDRLSESPAPEIATVANEEQPPTEESPIQSAKRVIGQIINALFQEKTSEDLPPVQENKTPKKPSVDKPPPRIATEDKIQRSSFEQSDPMRREEVPVPQPPCMGAAAPTDNDQSSLPMEDAAVGSILCGWARDAGWSEFDFLTNRVSRSRPLAERFGVHSLAASVGELFAGIVTMSWLSQERRRSWGNSLSNWARRGFARRTRRSVR